MMRRVMVADLREHLDETVTVYGWVKSLRLQRKMQFIILWDNTGLLQITRQRQNEPDDLEQAIDGLTVQSAIRVTGRVVDNAIVKLGGLEIIPESLEVLSAAEPSLPIDEKSGPEHKMDWRFLDLRLRPDARLVFDVQTTLEQAMRQYAFANGFTEMHTPKLMGTASESGAEVFKVNYFNKPAFLAQSPQFYKQMAIASGIERVFEIGPVFRAEPSFTSRHATEFTGVDAEMAWIDGVEDVMAFEEGLLHAALSTVAEKHGGLIEQHFGVSVTVPQLPFPRITMADALSTLRAGGWDTNSGKDDLDPEGERSLSRHIADKFGHEFVFVTHYPASVRPFYHMRDADQPDTTLSFDLLWKGLEITTGAQREHRYDVLVKQAAEKSMNTEPLSDYLNCFRYGTPPHGGLGMGLGRLLMVMLGLDSLRDVTFLFRGPNRLAP